MGFFNNYTGQRFMKIATMGLLLSLATMVEAEKDSSPETGFTVGLTLGLVALFLTCIGCAVCCKADHDDEDALPRLLTAPNS